MNQEPKRASPLRRALRLLIWALFAAVLFVRFVVLRDEHRQRPPNRVFWQQQMGTQPGRFRRPPTPVHPPVSEVPQDLLRIQIEISSKDVETLRGYYWNGWNGGRQERPEVLATVREGGAVYTNVAVHLKGAAGSFRPFDDKPALTLSFSKHAPGQRFHGYPKISLNNSVQDPTYLCEALCRELYDAAGVPVPRADWATVLVNERDLGLYVMLEGYGKEFLRRYFHNVKGNLYDGGFVQDINSSLAVNSGDHPEDHSDLDRLMAASSEPNLQRRWERLNEVLDMDRFVTLVAMEILLCHWDGYALNRNNYRLYHDLDHDRMVFMPHGMDQMFDYPPGRYPVDGTLRPMMRGRLARAVLSTPQGSKLYLDRLEKLLTNHLNEELVISRVRELQEHIRPTLAAYSPSLAQAHDARVASLCDRISRRIHFVTHELSRPREVLQFEASGTAQLTNWTQRLAMRGSRLEMDLVDEGGAQMLHLTTINQGGSASWRTRVALEPGQYRFEGRAKASAEAVGGRLCLRTSDLRGATPRLITSTNWIPLSYTFVVDGFNSEVTLACEFSSHRGQAWFDVGSLRLVRE